MLLKGALNWYLAKWWWLPKVAKIEHKACEPDCDDLSKNTMPQLQLQTNDYMHSIQNDSSYNKSLYVKYVDNKLNKL